MFSLAESLARPLLALLLGQVSAQRRILHRIEQRMALADRIRTHDAVQAAQLEAMASADVQAFIASERVKADRDLSAGNIFATTVAVAILLAPAYLGFRAALDWDSAWRWVAYVICGIWLGAVVGGACASVLGASEGDGEEATQS